MALRGQGMALRGQGLHEVLKEWGMEDNPAGTWGVNCPGRGMLQGLGSHTHTAQLSFPVQTRAVTG